MKTIKRSIKKIAILEFVHRRSRSTQMDVRDTHIDYAMIDKYKYLGNKPQIQFLEKKLTL